MCNTDKNQTDCAIAVTVIDLSLFKPTQSVWFHLDKDNYPMHIIAKMFFDFNSIRLYDRVNIFWEESSDGIDRLHFSVALRMKVVPVSLPLIILPWHTFSNVLQS